MTEIGVHHGRLFIGMHTLRRSGERSLAIDLFDDQANNVDNSGMGDERIFRRNVLRHAGNDDDLVIVSGDSTKLNGVEVRKHLGSGVRMFSVDGGHTSDIVKHDMETAQGSLVDGGIVIADDVYNQEWPGVAEGTLRYLDGGGTLVPFAIGFNKVLFTQAPFVESFREAVRELATDKRYFHKESVMHGKPVEIVTKFHHPIRNRVRQVPGLRPLYKFLRRR